MEKKENKKEETELKELLQRVQAEFENYKKRVGKEKEEFTDYANKEILLKLLEIVDNLELALNNKDSDEFKKGIELIYSKIIKLLEDYKVKKIITENESFNPELHEALMIEDSDEKDNEIAEELQCGYTINNKPLRTSKVKVFKRTKNAKNDT